MRPGDASDRTHFAPGPGGCRDPRRRSAGLATPRAIVLVAIAGMAAVVAAFALSRWMEAPRGMVWIPAGEFVRGSDDWASMVQERPAHRVRVDGFWMDTHEVTNAEFRRFVEATAYVTTAEKKPEWEDLKKQVPPGTPEPDASLMVPGSLVFTPPPSAVPLDDVSGWWRWVPGASWRHPEGPGSSIEGRDDHPVVQVSWDDAVAYARWAGKRLPTEAEWERAARGGLQGKRFPWGDEHPDEKPVRANIWQGEFPHRNTLGDTFERTAPVGSFPPNDYGLHDMAGNVWEWCSDWYRADAYQTLPRSVAVLNPIGPPESFDPVDPYMPKRVTRGGSFLCHASYCESYRPSARRGTAPDSGASHIGFRCVMSER